MLKNMQQWISTRTSLLCNTFLLLLLLITLIAVFVPLAPMMPATGLDPSWRFGVNQAVAQHLSFGKDIIFTFGPYASIYTKTYHPATDTMMLAGSLYLSLSYFGCIILLLNGTYWRSILSLCLILAGLIYLQDPLFFSLSLLSGLTTYKLAMSKEANAGTKKLTPFYMALLFAPLGLLPLTKGSLLILCTTVATLCAIFLFATKQRVLAIICLISPIVSMLFFWIMAGQPLPALLNYLTNMLPIISGYTEAMATPGMVSEIAFYLLASAFVLATILKQPQATSSKAFLFSLYALFLFIAFKAGFVRHDGHAVIAGTSLLIATLLLSFIYNPNTIYMPIIFAILSWGCIDQHYIKTSTNSFSNNLKNTYLYSWHGLKNRISDKNMLINDFNISLKTIQAETLFPPLKGTTDIYSYHQSYLIASGNVWDPRPTFQSYSAYTPFLSEMNRQHLLGNSAPDNIIFNIEPIDNRLPSIEDGSSWPLLLNNYVPTHQQKPFLFLEKGNNVHNIEKLSHLRTETHRLNEKVALPSSNLHLYARINIKPTILGRLANILFKPTELKITLILNNGTEKEYRLISNMARSNFLLSPLIENTDEFAMLYEKNSPLLDTKQVKFISIKQNHPQWLWEDEYTIMLLQ